MLAEIQLMGWLLTAVTVGYLLFLLFPASADRSCLRDWIDEMLSGSDGGGVTMKEHASRRSSRDHRDRPRLDRGRTTAAWVLAIVLLPALTAVLTRLDSHIGLPTVLLLFLALVLVIAALGGTRVAAVSAVAASLLVNWFFVEPTHTFTIAHGQNLVALVVFVAVALTVGALVDLSARRSLEARQARAEAETLAHMAVSLATDPDPVSALLDQVRHSFTLDSATITVVARGTQQTLAAAGLAREATATTSIALRPDADGQARQLIVTGRVPTGDDQRLLNLLADQLAVALDTQQLAAEAAAAESLATVDALRTALLRAVSHELRTPIATIKALVTGLLDSAVHWTPEQVQEALQSIDEETDRLNRLVGNLLDASRLQIGSLAVNLRPTAIPDVVDAAIQSLGCTAKGVHTDVPDDLPAANVDPALLERSLANVIGNALRHGGTNSTVLVSADAASEKIVIRVIDDGPGIPSSELDRVLLPFQRLGDNTSADGAGLGLAITAGFVDAMNGSIALEETRGGGLTVSLTVPLAEIEAGR